MKPPRWADRFLEWYCRTDVLEEIQGDAYELFYRTVIENKTKARFQFAWNVLRFFRPRNFRKIKRTRSNNSTAMLKNYFIVGIRNAMRTRVTSSINVIGLSLGVGIAIAVFIIMDFMLHMDGFHTNKKRIYQITSLVDDERAIRDWGDTPFMLGPSLKADNPAVEASVRVKFGGGAVRYNEAVFNESIWFVDKDFMNIFSFPVVKGNGHVSAKNAIIITDDIADKYFGTTDPINQTLSIKFNNGTKEDVTVAGVVKLPENSGMRFGILMTMEAFESLKVVDITQWSSLTDATFIMMNEGHSIHELSNVTRYQSLHNTAAPEWKIEGFTFNPFETMALRSNDVIGAITYSASPTGIWSLGSIALMLLLLACFNYMNVAVATVTTRLKEIGIRKAIGSQRKEIIQQFLTENFLLCSISIGLGGVMAAAFFLPGFNSLFPFTIPFATSSGPQAFYFFFGLLLFVGLVSGAYPAFYISSFTPISIFNGREKFSQRSLFSRILLTMQFVLAFTTIVGAFVFIDNAVYQKNKDWGYGHSLVIVVPVADRSQYLALRDKVKAANHFESIAGVGNPIGRQNTQVSFDHLQQRVQTVFYQVDFDYLETMDMRLKAGRTFDRTIQSDHTESVVVNEAFVSAMGWTNPLSRDFEFEGKKRYVIGVVRDFHYTGFYNPIGPAMFTIADEDKLRFLAVKTGSDDFFASEDELKKMWHEIAPDDPYLGYRQDSVFDSFHNDNNSNIKLLSFISAVAVILACLGLYGLVSYNITRRLKEFSVRKVFGANTSHIFGLMNRDYVWILASAFALGAPAGFFLINVIINQIYPDPKATTPSPFLIAVGLMALTVAITIGSQLKRVIQESPATTLRND
jgi:putative ABC transport system permease protein